MAHFLLHSNFPPTEANDQSVFKRLVELHADEHVMGCLDILSQLRDDQKRALWRVIQLKADEKAAAIPPKMKLLLKDVFQLEDPDNLEYVVEPSLTPGQVGVHVWRRKNDGSIVSRGINIFAMSRWTGE